MFFTCLKFQDISSYIFVDIQQKVQGRKCIWTKLRNSLGTEKATKLVKIQNFLKKNVEGDEKVENGSTFLSLSFSYFSRYTKNIYF